MQKLNKSVLTVLAALILIIPTITVKPGVSEICGDDDPGCYVEVINQQDAE